MFTAFISQIYQSQILFLKGHFHEKPNQNAVLDKIVSSKYKIERTRHLEVPHSLCQYPFQLYKVDENITLLQEGT